MARKILLADSDVDVLGELASALRTKGFTVLLAGDAQAALERARRDGPDVVLVAQPLAEADRLVELLQAEPELATIPRVTLVRDPATLPPGDGYALSSDVDRLMTLIVSVPPRSVPAEASHGEVRGDVSQVPLVDLLQVLSMNRRTGVLSITTNAGAGEVRIAEGEVFDAVYRRLDGEKALYRLLSEGEGTFAFVPGGTAALRRITTSTSMLVLEAMRQADEVARLRSELAPGGDAIVATTACTAVDDKVERALLELLQVPRAVDEVLDELHASDLQLLETMKRIMGTGLLRRIARAALMTKLASDDRMQVLRALVARLVREGFLGPPRIAIAAEPPRLATIAGAILRIEDAIAPHDPSSTAPLPSLLATLRLGESVELAVVGVPLVDKFSPVWGLVLPGTAAVLKLDSCECAAFDAACAAAEVPLLHAAALLGEVEEGDPVQVAALLRATLETAAGA